METPKLFVTTYNAYNSGKQFEHGQWVEVADYPDFEDFDAHCREIYANEADPEFMITDFEGFPRQFYAESGLPTEGTYSILVGFGESDQQEEIEAFLSCRSEKWADWDELKEAFEDAYVGSFKSDEDFAYDYVESTGMLGNVPDSIQRYFDYEALARDLMMDGYSSDNGYYFRD